MMNHSAKIYVAGHTGLVGSAIVRKLTDEGYNNLVTCSLEQLDLRRQKEVETFFEDEKPEYVFLAAAKVGGIFANNTYPAEFIYDNIMISTNIIHASYVYGVKKLLNLGSSCIYPKNAPQPMKEEYLLTSLLEPTNEPYAIAKIAAIKLCHYYNKQYRTNFISVMPTNMYGPNDNYNLKTSHVLPALIRKCHEAKLSNAKELVVWGTGRPYREFLYVDDLAEAIFLLMQKYDATQLGELVNIGTGNDIRILELAEQVKQVIGYEGDIVFDTTKPDGMQRKLLDVSKMNEFGWQPKIKLEDGIKRSYESYLENLAEQKNVAQEASKINIAER